jgi:hypothetical protein
MIVRTTMTAMKRLISVGVASVAIATGTLIVSSPAHAEQSEACIRAYNEYRGAKAVAGLYDIFLLPRPFGLDLLIEMSSDAVMEAC